MKKTKQYDKIDLFGDEQIIADYVNFLKVHMEVISTNGKHADVMIPSVQSFPIEKDYNGRYIVVHGHKIHSRYL